MKKNIVALTFVATLFVLTLIYIFFLPKKLPIDAAASPGYFNCRWTTDFSGKILLCDINSQDGMNCNPGETVDVSKCPTYTTQATCESAPEFRCLSNVPTYQPTGANCTNRKGLCSTTTYPNCVDSVSWVECSGGGPNYCSIPHYTPMGTASPYNLVSCTSKSGPVTPSGTLGSPSNCPVCESGWAWNSGEKQCQRFVQSLTGSKSEYKDPTIVNCTSTTNTCYAGTGCTSSKTGGSTNVKCENDETGINTAIGCIHVLGSPETFLADILRWAVGIGGGIAFLLIIYAGFMIMTGAGNPERLKAGQELLTSAISGLILLVFSIFILKFIGVDILGLCKFGFGGPCPVP